MRWLYAASLVLGMLALVFWAVRQSARRNDADIKPHSWVPRLVAGAVAFGMGGLSASYAGWNPGPAAGAAVVAAGLGVMLARWQEPADDQDQD
jgi:peptidoglycan/LPS O-acetylase OafA/YrhL